MMQRFHRKNHFSNITFKEVFLITFSISHFVLEMIFFKDMSYWKIQWVHTVYLSVSSIKYVKDIRSEMDFKGLKFAYILQKHLHWKIEIFKVEIVRHDKALALVLSKKALTSSNNTLKKFPLLEYKVATKNPLHNEFSAWNIESFMSWMMKLKLQWKYEWMNSIELQSSILNTKDLSSIGLLM